MEVLQKIGVEVAMAVQVEELVVVLYIMIELVEELDISLEEVEALDNLFGQVIKE